jgi:hypothetical protein
MSRHIAYHEGRGVAACHPSDRFLARVTGSGGIIAAPQADVQIERFVKAGTPRDAAVRYVRAACTGGLSMPEALAVIRDAHCWYGSGHVLLDRSAFPATRWFRPAWRLTGSRIHIDLEHARELQAMHIHRWREWFLKKHRSEAELGKLLGRQSNSLAAALAMVEEMDLRAVGDRLRQARSIAELRAIWPANDIGDLPCLTN